MTERNPIPECLSHLEQLRLAGLWEAEAACDLVAPTGGGVYSQGWIAARESCRAAIRGLMPESSLPITRDATAPVPPATGMTLAERTLLLSVVGWLSSVLMGHVLVAPPEPPHSGLSALDGAAILRNQAEAVRRESQP